MSDPQTWTLIGVFAAALFGMLGVLGTWFPRLLRAELSGLESRLTGRIDSVESKLTARIDSVESRLDARIDKLEMRIDSAESRLATKIDHLDRDVSAIAKRVFPDEG